MSRALLALVALVVIGCIGVVGYSCATRTPAGPELVSESLERTADAGSPALLSPTPGTEQASPAADSEASASPTIPPDTLAKWIADATGDDPKARAAAITSLADAPRSEALPVLQRVLNSGEPEVDRQLALNSLRALALYQGDADGAIRNVLRQAIYHGDDEATAHGAQAVLDVIEGAPGQTTPTANP